MAVGFYVVLREYGRSRVCECYIRRISVWYVYSMWCLERFFSFRDTGGGGLVWCDCVLICLISGMVECVHVF